MDNLESQTYEVFEKDPIKYSQYQQVSREVDQLFHLCVVFANLVAQVWLIYPLPQAVYKCLLDRVPEEQKETNIQWVLTPPTRYLLG